MRDEIFLNKVKQAINIIDEIDEMIETQGQELQKIDYELSDLYHFIENENMSNDTCIKVIERIKYLRLIRRSLNNEYTLEKVYKENSSKMMGNNTRGFLLNTLCQTNENLKTEYKNRVLTDEDIKTLVEETPHKRRGRPPKKKEGFLSE